ncbi:membrane protease YdiL (CAAX protease family) [Murinocardiopsis flavida]|uniref:Membrane protease YdiL (CAAX protease family) n=1 Tax=Murinocardiopsis flavida TaxID=645275 RepID=A0A2P8DRR9_9ACTN|nr:CPBP family intramembrane glutamic endopeptidase [Murinocardiopsis flavida]PSK99907.1 membrane protease YdiL (CAAX protease family) [Murinocardiopsis flavida]
MTSQPPAWAVVLDHTATRTATAVLLTFLCTGAMILAGQPLGVAAVLLLVYLWRRVARRPWSGLGLRVTWAAVAHGLLGVAAAVAATLAANAAAVALGAARWVPWEPDGLAYLPVAIAMIVVVQAFPEELLWRGNLHDILADRLPPLAVMVLTSVAFGSLHVLSQSEADGAAEVALYAVGAAALGFACAASRERTGTLWAAIGIHSGFYFANGFVPTEPAAYGVQLTAQAAVLTAVGMLFLVRPRPRVPIA